MSDQKFIVTKIISKDQPLDEGCLFAGQEIDTLYRLRNEIDFGIGADKLTTGDILDFTNDGKYIKKQFNNCEPAIVTGMTYGAAKTPDGGLSKIITAFSAKYGDIEIRLPNHIIGGLHTFIYTQRGDEILIRKNNEEYEIVTNQTVDKMRSDWLIKNSQKTK